MNDQNNKRCRGRTKASLAIGPAAAAASAMASDVISEIDVLRREVRVARGALELARVDFLSAERVLPVLSSSETAFSCELDAPEAASFSSASLRRRRR
ncbi:MAG: hypothetical protein K9G43_00660 [Rhodobacteraceae bacterium]|nr:hypothetical protein [Paracoccaceae bacterium]